MSIKIIDKTSNETHGIVWAEIDGVTYGIHDTFEPHTLMECDQFYNCTNCDLIDNQSMNKYVMISEQIEKAYSQYTCPQI